MLAMTRRALRHYATLGLIACAASWGPMTAAQTLGTPVVAVNSLPIDESTSFTFSGNNNMRGPAFQTGAVPTRIVEAAFGLDLDGLPSTATLGLYQLDSVTNFPTGAALASTTIDMLGTPAATDVLTYSAAQLGAIATTTLLAGQKYALILSNASDVAGLTNDDNNDNAYTYAAGFSTAGNGYVESTNSGTSWQPQGGTPAFRLTIAPIVPNVSITCTPTELLATAGQVSTCTVTISDSPTTDTPINLTLPAINPGYTTTCTSPLVIAANATQASCTITAVANTTPGAPDVVATIAVAPPTTEDAYTVEGDAAQVTIRADDVVVPPVAAPTPVPTLGTVGLVSLVSVMGLLGLRRSRKSV